MWWRSLSGRTLARSVGHLLKCPSSSSRKRSVGARLYRARRSSSIDAVPPHAQREVMDLELKGKVVFIPGGGGGIGLACARAFAREGAKVAIAGRSAEKLEAAVRALDAEGLIAHAE